MNNHEDSVVKDKEGALDEYPLAKVLCNKNEVTDTEGLRLEVLDMVAALERSQKDLLTGLSTREPWYRHLHVMIGEILSHDEGTFETILSHPHRVMILREFAQESFWQSSFVAYGDIALLAFANELSHMNGDNFLRLIAEHILKFESVFNADGDSYVHSARLSGDEFALFIKGCSYEDIDTALRQLSHVIESSNISKTVPNFERYGILPRLNLGLASLSEAMLAVADICEQGLDGEKHRRDLLADTVVTIADIRSQFNKSMNHTKFVIGLLRGIFTGGYYRWRALKPFVLKGCSRTSKLKMIILIGVQWMCSEEYFDAYLERHICKNMSQRAQTPVDRLLYAIALAPWCK